MVSQVVLPSERLSADVARVRPLVSVRSLVYEQVVAFGELSVAKFAYELFLGSRGPTVAWQTDLSGGGGGGSGVRRQLYLQLGRRAIFALGYSLDQSLVCTRVAEVHVLVLKQRETFFRVGDKVKVRAVLLVETRISVRKGCGLTLAVVVLR